MKTIKVMITPDNDVIQKYSIRNPAQIEFFIVTYTPIATITIKTDKQTIVTITPPNLSLF